MIKKVTALCLLLILLISAMPVSAAPDSFEGYPIPIDLSVNGSFIKCNQKPFLLNGTTYIPLRAFSDAIGAELIWNDAEQSATVLKDGHTLVFYAEENRSILDGATGPGTAMHYGLLFVPLRAICNTLGYSIEWDGFYYVVNITATDVTIPEFAKDYSYNYEDLLYLAKITHIESGAEPFKTRIGVANTVINRVRSPLYPNNIKDAIFDTKYGVQYPPAHTDKMNVTPSLASMLAAKCALNGVELVGDSVSFVNVSQQASSWVHNNMQYYTTLGTLAFYRFP